MDCTITERNPQAIDVMLILFHFNYISLKDSARFGDVSKEMYLMLKEAENANIIDALRVTADELIDILIKGLVRAEKKYLHRNNPVVADHFARRRIELKRRIILFNRSRPVDIRSLKQIILDTSSLNLR